VQTISRRAVLQAGLGLGLAGLATGLHLPALAAGPHFLTARELDTLRAVCDQLVPGPPHDPDPGAVQAGCAEAIDLLLAAFSFDPPLIHAGGPFSGRAGSGRDDFARFVPLDPQAELGWRIRLEGSKGRPEREFAGPVRGLQQVYRDGLAHLYARAGGAGFAALPWPAQLAVLQDQSDGQVQELVGAALANTLEAMYGPPEYGGNRRLAGWVTVAWQGDVQPRGYTAAQVSTVDPGAVRITAAEAEALLRRYLR
jgi:gluconate 2-dehydrogenase subunit 3-like protein